MGQNTFQITQTICFNTLVVVLVPILSREYGVLKEYEKTSGGWGVGSGTVRQSGKKLKIGYRK